MKKRQRTKSECHRTSGLRRPSDCWRICYIGRASNRRYDSGSWVHLSVWNGPCWASVAGLVVAGSWRSARMPSDGRRHHRNFIVVKLSYIFNRPTSMTVALTACFDDQRKGADKSAPFGPGDDRVGVGAAGADAASREHELQTSFTAFDRAGLNPS
jgi:hypothetical protein